MTRSISIISWEPGYGAERREGFSGTRENCLWRVTGLWCVRSNRAHICQNLLNCVLWAWLVFMYILQEISKERDS